MKLKQKLVVLVLLLSICFCTVLTHAMEDVAEAENAVYDEIAEAIEEVEEGVSGDEVIFITEDEVSIEERREEAVYSDIEGYEEAVSEIYEEVLPFVESDIDGIIDTDLETKVSIEELFDKESEDADTIISDVIAADINDETNDEINRIYDDPDRLFLGYVLYVARFFPP